MSLLIDNCSVELDGRAVLQDVSVAVSPGQWLAVIGPNGAGKSTLCRAVLGLLPFSGRVYVSGEQGLSPGARRWAKLVAYVPQRPVLPTGMTVTDYVLLGRTPHHSFLGAETTSDRKIVGQVLERLELGPMARRPLGHLSGGEVQRAVLGRALAQEPSVLVMDEPTTSLDMGHSQMVLELTDQMRRENQLTILCTLHDLALAGQYADNVLVLCQGRTVLHGTPDQVLTETNIERFFQANVRVAREAGGPCIYPLRRSTSLAPR